MDLYGHNPFTLRSPEPPDGPIGYGYADFSELDALARWLDRYGYRDRRGRRLRLFLSEFTLPTDHCNHEFNFWVPRDDSGEVDPASPADHPKVESDLHLRLPRPVRRSASKPTAWRSIEASSTAQAATNRPTERLRMADSPDRMGLTHLGHGLYLAVLNPLE